MATLVSTTPFSGDGTLTLTNGSTEGRAVLILAAQNRTPANITDITINGESGAVLGMQVDAAGFATLAILFGNADLPATADDYPIARVPSLAGGTDYVAYELAGVSAASPEVVSEILTGEAVTDPFVASFTTSAAGAFLAMAVRQITNSPSPLTGGTGQSTDFSTAGDYIGAKFDATSSRQLSTGPINVAGSTVYTAIALDPLPPTGFGITNVNGDNTIVDGGNLVIPITNGSGADYVVSLGGIDISALITADSATEITLTGFQIKDYILNYGAATLQVTDGANSDTLTATIEPGAGYNSVLLGTLADSGNRITAVPDLASGDTLEWGNVTGGTIADVTVNNDGTFVFEAGVTAFDVRAFTPGEGWGAFGTQTTAAVVNPGLSIPIVNKSGTPVADQSDITVVVRASVTAAAVLHQTATASITGGVLTIDSDDVGAVDDTVCVTMLSADGLTGGLWPAAPVIDLNAA